MKKILVALAGVILFFHTACSEEKETKDILPNGQTTITLPAEGGTQKVTTKNSAWWIGSCMLNGKNLLADPSVTYVWDKYRAAIGVKSATFSFMKKNNILEVNLLPVADGETREFTIALRDGNYFNHLYVIQK